MKKIAWEKDYNDPDYLDTIIPSTEDFIYSLDIEKFIYKLSEKEAIVLLFLSMGFKAKEIKEIMGYKNVNNINKIVMSLKKTFNKEYF